MEAHWRETTCCLRSEVEPLRRGFAGTLLNLSTSERQHWMRRKMLRGWVSLWGSGRRRNVWQRLSIESGIELIIWAVIRHRGKKTWMRSAHSSSHLSFNFPLHYFCHYTPVSWSQWWNLYFGWQVSAWLHLMSGKWFIIQMDHIRSVTWTFWFDIDH